MEQKQKPQKKIEHLINWYHGNFCVKHEESTREHYEELRRIAFSWNVSELTHKEFSQRIHQELKCNPKKREIFECVICKALGISRQRQ